MTSKRVSAIELAILQKRKAADMKLDLFDGAKWRQNVSEPSEDGSVTVTLSTGKTVTVDSKLLGFLRVLADELSKEEPPLH